MAFPVRGQQFILQQRDASTPGRRQVLEHGVQGILGNRDQYQCGFRYLARHLVHVHVACERMDGKTGTQEAARKNTAHLADSDNDDW